MQWNVELELIRLDARLSILESARSRWRHRKNSVPCGLLQQLTLLKGRSCSIPVDQIFGLLGICDDVHDKDIEISYETPFDAIYIAAAVHCIKQGSLKVLSLCQYRTSPRFAASVPISTARTPTWVPDWSVAIDPDEPRLFANVFGTESPDYTALISGPDSLDQHSFQAAPKAAARFNIDAESGYLQLTGIKVARIADFRPSLVNMDTLRRTPYLGYRSYIYRSTEQTLVDWFQSLVERNHGHLTDAQLEAFCCTILALGAHDQPTPSNGYILQSWIQWARGGFRGTFLLAREGTDGFTSPEYANFLWAMDAVIRTRMFAITEDGRFGLVPAEAAVGDLVAILWGGEVPFVLRTGKDQTFELVGECYFYGIMNGEALTGDHKQNVQEITLC